MTLRKLTPKSHQKKTGIPTMGGILIITTVFISVLICGKLNNEWVILSFLTLLGFGLLGFLDDFIKNAKKDGKGIGVKIKLFFQMILALSIVLYLYFKKGTPHYIHFPFDNLKESITLIVFPFFSLVNVDLKQLYIPFAVFIIIAFSNAVNFTDGLDGLAIGLTLLVMLSVMGFAYLTGNGVFASYLKIPFIENAGEITVFAGALVGACLGFLWFNAHPAQIFMGDTGSLALGSVIGILSLILKIELLIPIIGGVFVLEALSVLLQILFYKLFKKRIFKMAPLHHHFEMMGWSESKIIFRFWIVGAIFALIGFASLKIR